MDGISLNDVSDLLIDPKDYEVIQMIGNGSYGAVYLVKSKSNDFLYSMKYIQCQMMNHIQKQYLTREIEIMAKATHPALLSLRGYSLPSSDNNTSVATIITDYMSKGSLFQMIQLEQQHVAPFNYNNTTKNIIIIGIAAGMKYLHNKNIMHRDLKPENILLNDKLEPHIGDFGLSKLLDNQNKNGQANTVSIGTPLYMAPEIFTNSPYDFKVDVYAFGMILYEILTSLSPFKDITNPMALGMKICNGERPSFPPNFSPVFQVLIDRCWASNPDHRPTFDEIVEYLYNPQVLVEGADVIKVNEYCQKVIAKFQDDTQKANLNENSENNDYSRLLKIIKENSKTIDTLKTNFQTAMTQFKEETKKMQDEISELKKEESKILSSFRLSFQNNQEHIKKLTEEHKNLMQELQKLKRETENVPTSATYYKRNSLTVDSDQNRNANLSPSSYLNNNNNNQKQYNMLQQQRQLQQQRTPQQPIFYQYPPNSCGSNSEINLNLNNNNLGSKPNPINSTPVSQNYRPQLGSNPNLSPSGTVNINTNTNLNLNQNQPLGHKSTPNPNPNINTNSPTNNFFHNSTPSYNTGNQPRA